MSQARRVALTLTKAKQQVMQLVEKAKAAATRSSICFRIAVVYRGPPPTAAAVVGSGIRNARRRAQRKCEVKLSEVATVAAGGSCAGKTDAELFYILQVCGRATTQHS